VKLSEIVERQEQIRAELKQIEDNPGAVEEADGDYTDTLIAEFDTLEERRQPLAERAAKLNLISVGAKNEDGIEDGDSRPQAPTQVYRNRRDPFEDLDSVRSNMVNPSELRGRAADAIEWVSRSQWCDFPDEHAERATQLVQSVKGAAKHVLLTGTQEYYEAFRSYVSDPESYRATTVGTASLGFMLPFPLDPTIILTNVGSANPYRQISRVVQTTSNTWNGVTSAGVNAAFVGESVASADASPTVGQVQITPLKATAWVFGSFESIDDSDLGSQLPMMFADAKDRLEESAMATGTGTTTLLGAVTQATTGNTAAATAYAVADVYTLQARLGPRFRNSANVAWIANLAYINKTRQFDTAGGSSFWANLGQDTPERLLGKPIYESSSMSTGTASASKVLLFGDFQQYIICDRIGMSVLYNPMVTGTGASANLPTGQAGWYAHWRVGTSSSTATGTANALQVLQIQ
jgi:HK97 family phage major capsid protein